MGKDCGVFSIAVLPGGCNQALGDGFCISTASGKNTLSVPINVLLDNKLQLLLHGLFCAICSLVCKMALATSVALFLQIRNCGTVGSGEDGRDNLFCFSRDHTVAILLVC